MEVTNVYISNINIFRPPLTDLCYVTGKRGNVDINNSPQGLNLEAPKSIHAWGELLKSSFPLFPVTVICTMIIVTRPCY